MSHYIVDTTLRDGEQSPGVMFNLKQKLEIASMLDKLGIDEVEVGTPAMGIADQNDIRALSQAGFGFKTIAWCRALKKDIDAAALCQTDAVNISFPVSSIQLAALGRSVDWVVEQLPLMVAYAKRSFDSVYIGFQDGTRCDMDTLERLVTLAQDNNVDRIRIADTVGIMTPLATAKLFDQLHENFPLVDFEFHAHNDLGMATANAFVALESGATGVSATINGLGERAGNSALEELLVAKYMKTNSSPYQLHLLQDICAYVEQVSEQALAANKPIVGKQAFTHETGIHVNSLLKNKMSYQAFDESVIGKSHNDIVLGKHSGRHAYAFYFKKKGLDISPDQLNTLYGKAQQFIYNSGKSLCDEQLMSFYNQATCGVY